MNILFICGYAAEYKGNFIESLMQLDETLHGRQNACYIFPREAKNKIWIKELQNAGAKIFFNTNSVVGEIQLQNSICKKNKIDVIYHHFWNLKDCLASKILKIKHPKLKIVIHYHNEYHLSQSRFKEKLKHWILNTDMQIGCGKYVAEEVADAGYMNVKWIDNCINFSRLDHYELFSAKKGLNLLTFSSYDYEAKGIDISIKSCFAARKNGIPVNLLIVVSCNKDEIETRIISECKELGIDLPEWIQILPSRTDVATYYRSVDAYLNSSRSEGFCYASVEAIYCGAQVIQSDHPGNRLDIPRTLIYRVEDVEGCTKAIEELYFRKQNNIIQQDNQVQRQYVIDNYSIDTWTKKVSDSLKELI